MTCPYLTYRLEDDDYRFETERAFCTVVEEFVQPMRADICNDRYELDHEADCEYYRAHEELEADENGEDESETDTDGGVERSGERGGSERGGGERGGVEPDGVASDSVDPGGEDS